MPTFTYHEIQSIASEYGLNVFSSTDVAPLREAEKHLERWQEQGYAADMSYMSRRAADLTDPGRLLPEARSVVIFSVRYEQGPAPRCESGFGRVARYAWGRDYHRVLKKRLQKMILAIEERSGCSTRYRIFSDAVPLTERALAERAQIGFIGKNTMLIRPRIGSFTFLAEVLWSVEITGVPKTPSKGSCGSCTSCLDKCPTKAFEAPYKLNASKCISYLTIEKRSSLEDWERRALGEWVFGCDICQEVCPFNYRGLKNPEPPEVVDFTQGKGVGPLVELEKVISIRSDRKFVDIFAGTPLMRAKREGLVRNACVVAANTRAEKLSATIESAFMEDPSPLVRQHSLWALVELKKTCDSVCATRVKSCISRAARDENADVRLEAEKLHEIV